MTFEQMKALMGKDATDAQINTALEAFKKETKTATDEETNGLVKNKEKLLTQMDKLKKNQMPDGFDQEAYDTYNKDKDDLAKKKKDLEDQELEGKGQWEALKLKLNETHATTISELTTTSGAEIAGLRTALDKELIENNAIKEIEVAKGNSLFLLPHMRNHMKTVVGEDGTFSVHVLDNDGNQRLQDDATTPFTVKDLVAEFKANEMYAPAFPDLNSGSGNDANTGGKGGTGANPWKSDTKNITEQARITKENPTLAVQMRKAAGVS